MRYRHKRLTKYDEYEFEMIKKSKRYFSKCLVCGKILSNSCLNQLKAHRMKCVSKRCPSDKRDARGGGKSTRLQNKNIVQSQPQVAEPENKNEDGFDYDYPASLVETKYDQLSSDDSSSSEAEEATLENYVQPAELFDPVYEKKILETRLENLENTKCRGCFTYKVNILFSEAIEFYSEETHRNEDVSYLSMFHECTSIKINQNFDHSEGLCNYCAEELTISYSFRRKCLYANLQYMLLLNDDTRSMPQESTSQDNSMQSISQPPSMVSENPIDDIIEIVDDDDIVEIPTPATSTSIKQSKPVQKNIKKNSTPAEFIDINYDDINNGQAAVLFSTKQRISGAGQTYEYHKKCNDLERRGKMGLHQAATKTSQMFNNSKHERRLHKQIKPDYRKTD